ncbi:Cytochrome P450-like protein 6 [Elsinoe fawcettii]|nr:Cytochrome P450-like protein 6 [Elsinoe fawcettii]
MFEQIIKLLLDNYLTLTLVLCVGYVIRNKYSGGLNSVPGPFLASCTNWWRLFVVWGRRPDLAHIGLHGKYGSVVRIGPRTVSVSDPSALKTIYALNAGFIKSEFYPVQQVVSGGTALRSMFNTTDEHFHAKLRRAVSNAYAMSSLVQFEPLVDSTTSAFLTQLSSRYADRPDADGICDFGKWLQFYAFDVIGELTFSKRLGFVDRGVDVDGIISSLEWMLNYASVVGQMPWLDKVFLKNPIRMLLDRLGYLSTTSPIAAFAIQRMTERNGKQRADHDARSRDFLSRFLSAHNKDPDFISQERVTALTVANVFAGSDTTAISLRAIFYHLLQDPTKLQRLMTELDTEQHHGRLSAAQLVKWGEVRTLPYLSAVIKEALRCHPAVGLTLERVVPAAGIQVASHFIPGGTIVGCSPWTIHRSRDVFGEDASDFRPERWIEADEAKLSEMTSCLFSFGAGSRTCIGKNISYLEMYKLVPAVLRTFDLQLAYPNDAWKLHNAWFVKQDNFLIRLKTKR